MQAESGLSFSPASERNKEPIRDALAGHFPATGTVLEIGAGTGQHAVFLSQHFTGLRWLCSDRKENIPGLLARIEVQGGESLLPPVVLDVLHTTWPPGPFQAAYSANTAHIMHWPAVQAMFAGVGERLVHNAPFALYGPFNRQGQFTADSNRQFDASLRCQDPGMGLRDMEALELLAVDHQMKLKEVLPMPANNFMLIFRSERDPHE